MHTHTPLTPGPPAAAPALPFRLLRLFTHSMPGAQCPLPAPPPPHGSPSPRAHTGQQPQASRVSPSGQPRGGRDGQAAGSQGPQVSEEEEEERGRSRSSSPAAPRSRARSGGRSMARHCGGGGASASEPGLGSRRLKRRAPPGPAAGTTPRGGESAAAPPGTSGLQRAPADRAGCGIRAGPRASGPRRLRWALGSERTLLGPSQTPASAPRGAPQSLVGLPQ